MIGAWREENVRIALMTGLIVVDLGTGQTCTCCLLLLGLGGGRRLRLRPAPRRPWLELARTALKLDAIGQGEAAEQGEVQSYAAHNLSHV